MAHDLGRRLAGAGVHVVSGAAHGIDEASHRGALAAPGRTVAVLGAGIDVAYPRSNAALLDRILATGTVVSEYPPGVPAVPRNFPARNRIVAGLARALVVVEGAGKSGSRISVDHALDLGRDVFAVPGPVTSPLAEVPLALIREGATMIRGADDLLDDLGITWSPHAPPAELPAQERLVFEALTIARARRRLGPRSGAHAVRHAHRAPRAGAPRPRPRSGGTVRAHPAAVRRRVRRAPCTAPEALLHRAARPQNLRRIRAVRPSPG